MNNALTKIVDILKMLPKDNALDFKEKENIAVCLENKRNLLNISQSKIEIPRMFNLKLFDTPSPLKDSFVPTEEIKNIFTYLGSNNLYNKLNHLGICYPVKSISEEKDKLINETKKANWHLYEEASYDNSSWLYVGDIKNWKDPIIEFVLVEKTNDKWKNYWLPHFQIDIDTYLESDEIENLIVKSLNKKVKPFPLIEENGFVIVTRARLGIISGINICLDLGFEGRMKRYHRTKLLKTLV